MKTRVVIPWALSVALVAAVLLGAPPVFAAGINVQNVNFDKDRRQLIVKGKLDGFAAPTPVVVRNLSTGTMLASTTTDKQFGFVIPLAAGVAVPCEVQIRAGSEIATAEVRHGPGACARYTVTLTGVVTDEPIPNATVTVTLDGVTYTTVADSSGVFSLPITTANLNQLVKIDAAGATAETGEPINFTNLVGSFSRVLDEQQSGGSAKKNVTNVTTATYILVVEANGGEPTTLEQLEEAETAIDVSELIKLAALIKLIVDDPSYSLPPGETNLIAFISDPAKVETYLQTVAPADLAQATQEILADVGLVAGFTAQDIPSRYYDIPTPTPGYLARSGTAIEFDSGLATGRLLSYENGSGTALNQEFDWSIDGSGRLVLDMTQQRTINSFEDVATYSYLSAAEKDTLLAAGVTFIPVNYTVQKFTYTRITDGNLVDTASVDTQYRVEAQPVFVNGTLLLTPEGVPLVQVFNARATLRSSVDVTPIPFAASCPGQGGAVCVPGVWGGNFLYQIPGNSLNNTPWPYAAWGEVMTFATGGQVTGQLSNRTASWSIDTEGALVIVYSDGWRQRLQILDSLGLEYGVLQEYQNDTNPAATRFATYNLFVKANAQFSFGTSYVANATGSFWFADLGAWVPGNLDSNGLPPPSNYFGWQMDASTSALGGVGRNVSALPDLADCDGDGAVDDWSASALPLTWAIQSDGSLLVDRSSYRTDGTVRTSRLRSWYPIASTTLNGRRAFYAMEIERTNTGLTRIPPRMNIEREIPAPWSCVR